MSWTNILSSSNSPPFRVTIKLVQFVILSDVLTRLLYSYRHPQTSCITFILGNCYPSRCYLLFASHSLQSGAAPRPLVEEVIETDGKITCRVCSLAIKRMASNCIWSFLPHRLGHNAALIPYIYTECHNGEDPAAWPFLLEMLFLVFVSFRVTWNMRNNPLAATILLCHCHSSSKCQCQVSGVWEGHHPVN